MKVFNPANCSNVSPEEFSELTDLMLTSATAYPLTNIYPVVFGLDDDGVGMSPVIIQNDQEFSVLADWEGNVLTQGF